MVRLLVFAMLVWGAYHLVKKFLRGYHEHFAPERQQQDSDLDAELIQDPECGAYFMKQKGVKGVVDGKVVYFCSQQCYDRRRRRRNAR